MKIRLLFLFVIMSTIIITSCSEDNSPVEGQLKYPANTIPNTVLSDWIDLMLKITKETPGFSPPVSARAFAYTALAAYESVVPGMPSNKSMAGQLAGFDKILTVPESGKDYHWGICMNNAIATIMKKLYIKASKENIDSLNAMQEKYNQSMISQIPADVVERSKNYGILIGEEIYQYSLTDGQDKCYDNNFPSNYTPPIGDGKWIPTAAGQKAMQPFWGQVRTFSPLNSSDNVLPLPPLEFSIDPGSDFYKEGKEVYDVTSNLTADQIAIANFWSDDPGKTATPGGHSISIAKQCFTLKFDKLSHAVETFTKVAFAVHDAFVTCWKCKYVHNLLRPVTYINESAKIDPNWKPILSTPPFPEYTSGHSVQTGAATTILSTIYGENFSFTDLTHQNRTDITLQPRSFTSFTQLANETAISRLYGGIHFKRAIDQGVTQGKSVANNIMKLQFRK